MSIRAIARDLYRAQQKVNQLEKELKAVSLGEREAVQGKLRLANRELQMLRKILEGEKESSSFRMKFKGFGK